MAHTQWNHIRHVYWIVLKWCLMHWFLLLTQVMLDLYVCQCIGIVKTHTKCWHLTFHCSIKSIRSFRYAEYRQIYTLTDIAVRHVEIDQSEAIFKIFWLVIINAEIYVCKLRLEYLCWMLTKISIQLVLHNHFLALTAMTSGCLPQGPFNYFQIKTLL